MSSRRTTAVTSVKRTEGKATRASDPPDPTQTGTTLEGPSALGWLSLLSEVPLFRALSKRHLRHVTDLVELRRYKEGSTIVRAGTPGESFCIVLDGHARVETPTGQSKMLGAGESFGELALLDGAPRSATVSATDDLTLGRIGRPAFLKLIREEPTIAVGLAKALVVIVRELQRTDG